MPEETASTGPKTIDLDKPAKPPTFEFKKSKFYLLGALVLLVYLLSIVGAYMLGVESKAEPIEKKATESAKTSEVKDEVNTVEIGEEVVVKSGLTIKLEEAEFDQLYEKEKADQRKFYEKNASQSAYLQSDYFTHSNLILKVTLKNEKDTTVAYNPGSFRLKDSEDNQYTIPFQGERPIIYNLNPNETTKITLEFSVPSEETSFELVYENAIVEFRVRK